MNSLDVYFLKQTIKLAKKGEGKTSPNPLVGALIVKDKEIIGAGFHECCGQAHAEINALKKAKDKAKGAVLYVNLEPCSHYGRTPPCTKSIIDSGIKKVVIGLKDPNPLNNGRGIKLLRKAGILVEVLKNNEEYIQLNEIFIKYITKKIPFLAVKAGQSLDGKIAARNGLSKWITNETSRDYAQYLRKKYDALMIGVNTLIKDNPILSCRYKGILRQDAPIKIIIDPELITPVKSNIFSRLSPAPVIIVTCKKASKARMELFNDMGVDMIVCPSKKNGKID
ncbi:MAG: bifunctional diaminohydroxyphosphoribosylaminopyrimidine deaminase/5-amino-6-(5-phosphoribosylamino)uracil reductase RibD [Candidatus Omnitrophica bacterium]|nr:bifunctional diaminohydroxyphosphoribosylaminopyrimidine deaminase/5-amino-6-(5-phosphoribosylamino)uracil reductase RibD [Candidatus Omnitrophota bacterium]